MVSRPLSLSEIESLGITINPSNFTAYKFTVGFGTESGTVHMDIPPPSMILPQMKVPNFQVFELIS